MPTPLNLWINIPVRSDREISIAAPLSKPGDYLVLEALMDCVLVFSACPLDITPINGEDRTPRPVAFAVI